MRSSICVGPHPDLDLETIYSQTRARTTLSGVHVELGVSVSPLSFGLPRREKRFDDFLWTVGTLASKTKTELSSKYLDHNFINHYLDTKKTNPNTNINTITKTQMPAF